MPERIKRETKREYRGGDNIDDHPANHLPFAAKDEDDRLKTVNSSEKNESCDRDHAGIKCNKNDKINNISNGDGLDHSAEEVEEDDESHTETTEPTKLLKRNELDEVVDCGINPSSAL